MIYDSTHLALSKNILQQTSYDEKAERLTNVQIGQKMTQI